MREEEEEALIFTLETVSSHDLDNDKEAVSPLTTSARILSDDPHASAISMMPTACHRLPVWFLLQ
jgi:hypothetical protein